MELPSIIRHNWFQLLLIGALFALIWRACSITPSFIEGSKVIKTDTTTIYIPGKRDTVIIPTEKIVYRDRDFHHYHTDTLYNIDSSDFTIGYMYTKKDTFIDATIGVWAKEIPDSISFEYSALVPYITQVDTIKETITQKVRVNQVYLGPEAIVYPNFKGGFLSADFISNRGWQLEVGGGYGGDNGNLSPMVKVGFKKVISFRKIK